MSNIHEHKPTASSKLMHYGMMVCCAVMLLPVAAFFIAGGTIAGLWTNVGLFAPIALCLGAHVVMHKMMGKSCHGSKDERGHEDPLDAEFNDGRVPAQDIARSR